MSLPGGTACWGPSLNSVHQLEGDFQGLARLHAGRQLGLGRIAVRSGQTGSFRFTV